MAAEPSVGSGTGPRVPREPDQSGDARSVAALQRATDRLTDRVCFWPPDRWAVSVGGGRVGAAASVADIVFALVQRLARVAAQAESLPVRDVPRLDNDLILPDQLRVIVADLVAARPDPTVLDAATAEVEAVRARL